MGGGGQEPLRLKEENGARGDEAGPDFRLDPGGEGEITFPRRRPGREDDHVRSEPPDAFETSFFGEAVGHRVDHLKPGLPQDAGKDDKIAGRPIIVRLGRVAAVQIMDIDLIARAMEKENLGSRG